jgi:hypothetical protein
MLLTRVNKEAATSLVEDAPHVEGSNPFPEAIRKRVLNSTVKLSMTKKTKNELFFASGVIFKVDQSYTYILTAAHNVLAWAGANSLPADWADDVTTFGAQVKISYGSTDMTFNKDPTGHTTPGNTVATLALQNECGNREGCLYDVMLLKSSDQQLRTYAKKWVFGNATYSDIAERVSAEVTTVRAGIAPLLDRRSYYFVQLGYGRTMDERDRETIENGRIKTEKLKRRTEPGFGMKELTLHYRLALPNFKAVGSAFRQTAGDGEAPEYMEYIDAVSLKGPISSTTAVGDSGGPLYAIKKGYPFKKEEGKEIVYTGVYLLGVTTGADMRDSRSVSRWVFRTCNSTSLEPHFKRIT